MSGKAVLYTFSPTAPKIANVLAFQSAIEFIVLGQQMKLYII